MLAETGVDIINIARIRSAMERSGEAFLNKTFTPWEQEYGRSHPDPPAYFAMTFAAKEAIFKCFGIDWESGVQLTEIEVRNGTHGEPIPVLSGKFASLAQERGVIKVLLSLSYDTDYAIGSASIVNSAKL